MPEDGIGGNSPATNLSTGPRKSPGLGADDVSCLISVSRLLGFGSLPRHLLEPLPPARPAPSSSHSCELPKTKPTAEGPCFRAPGANGKPAKPQGRAGEARPDLGPAWQALAKPFTARFLTPSTHQCRAPMQRPPGLCVLCAVWTLQDLAEGEQGQSLRVNKWNNKWNP